MTDLSGQQLGTYAISEKVGAGGMATVYRAFHEATQRDVAIKVLPESLADDEGFVARFQREAQTLASLQHPHILPVFDYGQQGKLAYLVMPYLPFGTLKARMVRGLRFKDALRLFTQVASAVDYAHRKELLHRDIKPANVLLDESDNALLADFGLVKLAEDSGEHLTTSGVILGTPAYMSPEQAQSGEIDQRSDIYALGVMLYEMLVGKRPFEGDSALSLMYRHVNEPPPSPRLTRPDLPAALVAVMLQALAKRPEQRYQTAGDLIAALDTALESSTVIQMMSSSPQEITALGMQTATLESGPQTAILDEDKQRQALVGSALAEVERDGGSLSSASGARRRIPALPTLVVVLIVLYVMVCLVGGVYLVIQNIGG
ncbi:MAG: serine/threonine protein kinase [Chloroflexi bacterium]|nr:serine/threonine protein kinase [Chloroflexota bacterium]